MEKGYQYKRSECPECGEMLADNWYVRHMREKHPDPEPPPKPYIWSKIDTITGRTSISLYYHSANSKYPYYENDFRLGTLWLGDIDWFNETKDALCLLEDGLKRLGWWGKDEKVEANQWEI